MVNNDRKQMLPDLFKQLREKAKLPQKEVASALGIDTTTYCKIENGKYPANKEQVESGKTKSQLLSTLNTNMQLNKPSGLTLEQFKKISDNL